MRTCTVFHADQNLGGCGIKGARTCCKDCVAKPACATVCTKAYEVDTCTYEKSNKAVTPARSDRLEEHDGA